RDRRGLQYGRMSRSDVFDFDGRYPFAARLDNVLGSIRYAHVGVLVDRCDVAGVEIALLVQYFVIHSIVSLGNACTPNLQPAKCLSVVGKLLTRIISDLHFNEERRKPLARKLGDPLRALQICERWLQAAIRA